MALTRITKGVIKPNENYDTHNINSTGIVTAIGLDVNGSGDISGNLSVGGVLTYEDVTSIDSVGIITARDGIHVGAGVSAVGVGTFSGLDISGDIDVDGHTNLDNVSIAGVTTTTGNIHLNTGAKVGFATDSNTFIGQDNRDRLDFNAGGKRLVSIVEGTNIPVLIVDKDGVNTGAGNQGANYNANPNATELVLGNTSSNNHGMTIVSPSSGYGNIQFSDGSGGGLDSTRGSIIFTHSDNKLSLKTKLGSITLTHKDDDKLTTTDAGISIPKDLDVDGHTNLDNVSIVGVATVSGNIIATGAVDASGITITGSVPVLNFNDTDNNPDFRFLVNSNSFILEDTTNSQARLTVGATGNISINNDLDVDGHTNLDNVSIAGIATLVPI